MAPEPHEACVPSLWKMARHRGGGRTGPKVNENKGKPVMFKRNYSSQKPVIPVAHFMFKRN